MKNLLLTVKVTAIAVVINVIIIGFATCASASAAAAADFEDSPLEVKCLLDSELHQTTCVESCDYCGCEGEFLQDGLRCICVCEGGLFDSECLQDIKRTNDLIGLNYTVVDRSTHRNQLQHPVDANVRMLRQAEDCDPRRRRFRDREERRNNRRQNRRNRPRFNGGERRRQFRTPEPRPEPTRSHEDKFKPKDSSSSYYRD